MRKKSIFNPELVQSDSLSCRKNENDIRVSFWLKGVTLIFENKLTLSYIDDREVLESMNEPKRYESRVASVVSDPLLA